MTTTNKQLDAVVTLTTEIGDIDSALAETKWQLASFYNEPGAADALLALPENFDPNVARKRVDELLMQRHAIAAKLAEADANYKASRRAERDKAYGEIEKKYKTTVVTMLRAAVTLARAVADCEELRDEGRQITGGFVGNIPHIGPVCHHWDLRSRESLLSFWLAEARREGYLSGNESWLDGLVF